MGAESKFSLCDERVFKYPFIWRLPAALVLVAMVFLCISLLAISAGGGWARWLFLLLPIIFLALAFISLVGTAEIHISNEGVRRVLVGRDWRRIAWVDVAQIRSFPYYDMGEGRWVKVISLMPLPGKGRRLAFVSKLAGMDDLSELISYYSRMYSFDILISDGGVYKRSDSI